MRPDTGPAPDTVPAAAVTAGGSALPPPAGRPPHAGPSGPPVIARAALEPVEISAGQLHLRPWRPVDIEAVLAACQDPEIPRWTRVPAPYTRQHAEDFVCRQAVESWTMATATPLAVVDATTEELLASVALHDLTSEGDAQIGYWCAAPARGRGVTARAAGALLRWGFGALGLERVEWRAAVGNDASRRVAQKLGFSFDGTLRSAIVLGDGRRHDCWVGSRLATDPNP